MEPRAKLFGRPIHQMLVPIPVGLLLTAPLFDLVWALSGHSGIGAASYFNIWIGLASAAVVGLFGLIDLLGLPHESRVRRLAVLHGSGNLVVLGLFAVAALFRSDVPGHLPEPLSFGIELGAVALALVTTWLGSELVPTETDVIVVSRRGPIR
jgi:uncharacterized membrane protein